MAEIERKTFPTRWSPSMNVHYTEADLDRGADLYWLGQASDARLHEALQDVGDEALDIHEQATAKAVAEHKAIIDRQTTEKARRLLAELGMDLDG